MTQINNIFYYVRTSYVFSQVKKPKGRALALEAQGPLADAKGYGADTAELLRDRTFVVSLKDQINPSLVKTYKKKENLRKLYGVRSREEVLELYRSTFKSLGPSLQVMTNDRLRPMDFMVLGDFRPGLFQLGLFRPADFSDTR